jgi:putative redox protein
MASAKVEWKQNMLFQGEAGGHQVMMDASPPFGQHSHPTPKELLLVSMGGCTLMDIVSLLKKHKQNLTHIHVINSAEATKTQPQIYETAHLEFHASGEVSPEIFKDSIHLSLSKYCSVNAMLSKVVKITWSAILNSEMVGTGEAQFTI